jgi:hypothetical protein
LTNSLVYNIPAKQIESYRERDVIVRSSSACEIVAALSQRDGRRVRFIQLLNTPADTAELEACGEGIPIEIVLKDPAIEFPHLYDYTNLVDTHPVRVAIPVLPGFSKAVRLAVSLNFAVKLEMGQPDSLLIDQLADVLRFYLHGTNVRQPIDPFQTILLSFYRHEPMSLWEIAEEDPLQVRYIAENGEETISERFVGATFAGDVADFVRSHSQQTVAEKRQCHECEFFNRCQGFFKWPDKSYDCAPIKRIFTTLATAAHEVTQDLAAYRDQEMALPS